MEMVNFLGDQIQGPIQSHLGTLWDMEKPNKLLQMHSFWSGETWETSGGYPRKRLNP